MNHNKYTLLLRIISACVVLGGISSGYAQSCGNNADSTGGNGDNNQGNPDPQGDPFAPYTGNEYREVPDLTI